MLKKQRSRELAAAAALQAKRQALSEPPKQQTPLALDQAVDAAEVAAEVAAPAVQLAGHEEKPVEAAVLADAPLPAAAGHDAKLVEVAALTEPFAVAAAGAAVIAAAPVAAAVPLTAGAAHGCSDFVPSSRGTVYGFLPWVKECKCGRDEVLFGLGVACDPYASMGFNARAIFEKDGKDASACACTKQSLVPETHRVRSDLSALSLLQAETPTI